MIRNYTIRRPFGATAFKVTVEGAKTNIRRMHGNDTANMDASAFDPQSLFEAFEKYQSGALVQDAFHFFSPAQREWLITGDLLNEFFANIKADDSDEPDENDLRENCASCGELIEEDSIDDCKGNDGIYCSESCFQDAEPCHDYFYGDDSDDNSDD